MDYGKALRIARAIAGMEQKELAKAAELTPSHISLIEKGARKPSVGAITRICHALSIPEPLFNMLAAEAADVRGINEEGFENIAVYLAKFLVRREPTNRRSRSKRTA